MNNFQVVQNEYILPIDLARMSKAYDSLEEGHINAVKAQSELESAIAQLDMNSEEDQFKADLVNDLRNNIADHTLYGNMAGAYSTIIQQSGKILSSPEVLGRIKSQTEYKNFQDNLDKNTTLSDDMKEWFKELNPYYYTDKYNDQGQIIGGSEWKPNKNYYDRVDETDVMKALKDIVASQSTSWENVTWVDTEGNTYDNYQPGLYVGIQKAGKTEYITADQFKTAMSGLLRSNSKIANSIMQDYDYLRWACQQGKDNKILDSDGHIMTLDQYVDWVYNPLYNVAAYKRESWNTQYHYPLLMGAGGSGASMGAGGSGASSSSGGAYGSGNIYNEWQPHSTAGNPIKIKNTCGEIALKSNNEILLKLNTDFKNKDPHIVDAINQICISNSVNIDDIYDNIMNSSNLTSDEKTELLTYVDCIQQNCTTLQNTLNSIGDKNTQQQYMEKIAVDSNTGISQFTNDDFKGGRLTHIIDNWFNNFTTKEFKDTAILVLDAGTFSNVDTTKLKDLGADVTSVSTGNLVISVPSTCKNFFYNILTEINKAELKGSKFGMQGNNYNRINTDRVKRAYADCQKIYKEYEDNINKQLGNSYVEQDIMIIQGGTDLDSNKMFSNMINGEGGTVSQSKSKYDQLVETEIDLLCSTSAGEYNVYIPSMTNSETKQTRTLEIGWKQQHIKNALNNTKLRKDLRFQLAYLPVTGEYGLEITFPNNSNYKEYNLQHPDKYKQLFTGKSVFISIPTNNLNTEIMNNPSMRADIDIHKAKLEGQSFGFNQLNAKDANYAIGSKFENGNKNGTLILYYKGNEYNIDNKFKDVKKLREIELTMKNAYRYMASLPENQQSTMTTIVNTYIETYSQLLASLLPDDVTDANTIANDLRNNMK